MVGLATVICLLFQGYIFTYVLKVEPDALVSIAPILPFVLYIYARNRRVWWSHKPMYWIAAIIAYNHGRFSAVCLGFECSALIVLR